MGEFKLRQDLAIARKKIGRSWRPYLDSAAGKVRMFDDLVVEALESLPAEFAAALSNVEIIVEAEPEAPGLLGLYRGIPLTNRDAGYAGVLPDRISIYQGPIERRARSEDELKEMIRETVLHELAHHFGIDDERLRELGRD